MMKRIEGDVISAVEVAFILNQFVGSLESRRDDRFVLPVIQNAKAEHTEYEQMIDEVFQKFYSKYKRS